MNLPTPRDQYDRITEHQRNRTLALADAENLKHGQDVDLSATDGTRSARLILSSPDGNRWEVFVVKEDSEIAGQGPVEVFAPATAGAVAAEGACCAPDCCD